MKKEKLIHLLRIFIPLFLGSLVGILIKNHIDYDVLIKPVLSPPKIAFPIIWTILYLLMGIAYYSYRKDYNNSNVILLYNLQLFFNLMWTIIFFLFKWRLFSIFWILILLILILYLIGFLFKEKKISAYLLIPYFIWLLIASYLNVGIYFLN